MNIQKIKMFKDRKAVIQFINKICQINKIDIKKISVITHLTKDIEFYVLFNKKVKNKVFKSLLNFLTTRNSDYYNYTLVNKSDIEFKTINCGMCKYHILSYEEFKNKLIYNDEYYWSVCDNSQILLDLSDRYKKMIELVKNRKNWPILLKKIFC